MSLAKLKTVKPKRILGVDGSTHSFAWGLFVDGTPEKWGIVKYVGKDRFDRAVDSYYKVDALIESIGPFDFVMQEQAVGSINQRTGLVLAQAYGVTLKTLIENTKSFEMVNPNEWQAALGVKAKSASLIKKDNPDATKSWLNEESRKERKRRNIQFLEDTYGIVLPYEANDTADALCIAHYAYVKTGI